MTILFCTITFRYWDSYVQIWLDETVRHAFYSREGVIEWQNDMAARKAEAHAQAVDFDPRGVPDDPEEFEVLEMWELLTELT